MKTKPRQSGHRLSNILFSVAGFALAAGLAIIILTFLPLGREELRYATRKPDTVITPVDRDFGIVIPKLGANAHVVANVDPYDSRAYQYALTKGVAHARGTSLPGTAGDVFLFAHSSENFYEALQYNSVFYLINKLEKGDEIDLYYHDVKFVYTVTGKKFVNPKEVSYLESKGDAQTLTLMTCWPPGTNINRLIVLADLKK